MLTMRMVALIAGTAGLLALSIAPSLAEQRSARQSLAQQSGIARTGDLAISAQTRRVKRKRVTVRPLPRADEPLYTSDRRECRAVFTERNIPEWGGRVLYASQDCRWVR